MRRKDFIQVNWRMLLVKYIIPSVILAGLSYQIMTEPAKEYEIERLDETIISSIKMNSHTEKVISASGWTFTMFTRDIYVPGGTKEAKRRVIENLQGDGWIQGDTNRANENKEMFVNQLIDHEPSFSYHNDSFLLSVRPADDKNLQVTVVNYKIAK